MKNDAKCQKKCLLNRGLLFFKNLLYRGFLLHKNRSAAKMLLYRGYLLYRGILNFVYFVYTVFKIVDFFDFKITQIVDIAIPYFIAAFFLSNPAFIESSIKLFFSARDRRFLDGIVTLTERHSK